MATLQLTQVYLDPQQKQALQRLAQARGTKLAEEIRNAVDAYLAGVTSEELGLLDAATREAEKHLAAMVIELDATNKKLDRVFAEIRRLRAGQSLSTA